MGRVYSALAEINRRKILFWLRVGEMKVSQIVEKLELSQGTVSNHLSILRKSGLVDFKVNGKERIYRLNRENAEAFVRELNKLLLGTERKPVDEIIVRR